MPIFYYEEGKQNTLEMEPYQSFTKKYRKIKNDELDNSSIEIIISGDEDSIVSGFTISRHYAKEITLKFFFNKVKNSESDEIYAVRHEIEFQFEKDEDFFEVQREALEDIREKSRYLYIEEAKYLDFKYYMSNKCSQLIFTSLANEENIMKVSLQLINADILLFARRW